MSPEELHSWLEGQAKRTIQLRINENRSTMVSVRGSQPVRVSVHRMFLDAPDSALRDLAQYVGGRCRSLGPSAQRFMAEKIPQLSYGERINAERLSPLGHVYDLNEIYDRINREYFEGSLDLKITWYGERGGRRRRSSATLGLYSNPLKLIRIHRRLDATSVPEVFVEFVVYHEMIHHVCPPYVDALGRNRIHSPEFKARERQFREYGTAMAWLKKHENILVGKGF